MLLGTNQVKTIHTIKKVNNGQKLKTVAEEVMTLGPVFGTESILD